MCEECVVCAWCGVVCPYEVCENICSKVNFG